MDIRVALTILEDAARMPSAFDRWFAGSKITTPDGKPLKLYHGTSKDGDFKSFRLNKNGIWFTTDPKSASDYAKDNDSQGFTYDDKTRNYVAKHTAARVIPVYVKATNVVFWDEWPEELRLADNYKRAQAKMFQMMAFKGVEAIMTKDGVVVVIGPGAQIKSAIGNRGAFDPAKKNLDEDASQPPAGFPPVLRDYREIAQYIVDQSKAPVDQEFVEDHYRGAKAILRLIPIAELIEGSPDTNIRNKAKEKRYAKMDPATMPPLVVEFGRVSDGNHRLRVAVANGAEALWCYDVVEA